MVHSRNIGYICAGRGRQQGLALLVFVIIIALGGSYLLLSTLHRSSTTMAAERDHKTQQALRDAKAAVLGWVAEDALSSSMPGRMPCPEDKTKIGLATEGEMAGSCTSSTAPQIGRLAWKSLHLGDLRDGWGEKLWYVLSPGFRSSPINSSTAGQLTLDGQAVVALIIAPGQAVNGQSRPSFSAPAGPAYTNYFEGENATSPANLSFTATGSSDTFNDRVIAITAREVFDIVEPIAARRISTDGDFASYANQWGTYPFAATFADPSTGYSQFRGVTGAQQGLVPSARESTDSSFVNWSTTISWSYNGAALGTVTSSSCSLSSSVLTCNIVYRCNTAGLSCNTGNPNTPLINITLTANNVGKAFKNKIDTSSEIDYSWIGSFSSTPADPAAPTQSLDANGNLAITWTGLRLARYTGLITTRTLRIVVQPVSDHSVLNSWFFTNEWYRVAYYGIAPKYTPGASSGNCVSVNSQNSRVAVILTGQALNGQKRTATPPPDEHFVTIADYLEGTNLTSANAPALNFTGTTKTSAANDLATGVGSCTPS